MKYLRRWFWLLLAVVGLVLHNVDPVLSWPLLLVLPLLSSLAHWELGTGRR